MRLGDDDNAAVDETTPLVSSGGDDEQEHPPLRVAILAVMPMFMGYAALFSLQRRLLELFVFDSSSPLFSIFEFGCSWLYIGNLVMRMGHNFILAWMRPRWRVVLSYISMFISMVTLGVIALVTPRNSLEASSMWFIFVCYFLGGFGIGNYEANLLNVLVPLGHGTKQWAIYGMPTGVLCVTVGGFLYLEVTNDLVWPLYVGVSVLLICAFLIYEIFILHDPIVSANLLKQREMRNIDSRSNSDLHRNRKDSVSGNAVDEDSDTDIDRDIDLEAEVPEAGSINAIEATSASKALVSPSTSNKRRRTQNTFKDFVKDVKMFRMWLPVIAWHVGFMSINMFSVSVEMPLGEYCYPQQQIVFGPFSVSHDIFIVIYSVFFGLGDTLSRKIFYPKKKKEEYFGPFFRPLHPSFFVIFGSAVGIGLVLTRIPWFAILGALLMALANGGIYAQTVFRIDQHIDYVYNLTALSVWLFLGDCGAVIGTNMIKALMSASK